MYSADSMRGSGSVDYYIGGGGGRTDHVTSYYLDPQATGEPQAYWQGAGAESLGLHGEIVDAEFAAIFGQFLDPRDTRFADPATRDESDLLGARMDSFRTRDEILAAKLEAHPGTPTPEEYAALLAASDKAVRHNVIGWDMTFNAPKDFTLALAAAGYAELQAQRAGDLDGMNLWAGRQADLKEAAHAANKAALEYAAEAGGYARKQVAGAERYVPVVGYTSASFEQHDNRSGAPHFHIHNPTLARVETVNGDWLSVDGKAVIAVREGMSAVGDRILRESMERLGYATYTREDGVTWAIEGIDDEQRDIASERTKTINAKTKVWADAFTERYGREPSALELNRLKQTANLKTRSAKKSIEVPTGEQLDQWHEQLNAGVAGGLQLIADRHEHLVPRTQSDAQWSRQDVIMRALDQIQTEQTTWSRYQLMRRMEPLIPSLGGLGPEDVTRLLEGLADEALTQTAEPVVKVTGGIRATDAPDQLRRHDGTVLYESPTAAEYALTSHLAGEQALRRLAVRRDRLAADPEVVRQWLDRHVAEQDPERRMSPDQMAAAERFMTGGSAMTTFVGPAGTGKSTTIGVLNEAWPELTGGRVFGIAASEQATNELRADGLQYALNITAWLAVQQRLAEGRPIPSDQDYVLGPDSKLVIDELSMASTQTVLKIVRDYADKAGAAVIGTGDPYQMGSIGAGGIMADLAADESAEVVTLSTVHRFQNPWEATASLRLRDGDEDVVTEYSRHGRLHDGGTAEEVRAEAARQYTAARLQGKTAAVVAETNDEADQISGLTREALVAVGLVEADGVLLGMDGNTAGVGDLIACRQIDRSLGVANREKLEVVTVNDDGSIDASTATGTLKHLPAGYVTEHVALGYASTIYGVQGATVQVGITAGSAQMSRQALYTGATRGAESNTLIFQTTVQDKEGHYVQQEKLLPETAMREVLAKDGVELSATTAQEVDQEQEASVRTVGGRLEDGLQVAFRERTDRALDQLTAEGALSEDDRAQFCVDQGTTYLSRLLRTAEIAGHDPDQVLRQAIEGKSFKGARSVAQVTADRIHKLKDVDLTPTDTPDLAGIGHEWVTHFEQLAAAAGEREHALADRLVTSPPAWAVRAFGDLPADEDARAEWAQKAASVERAREWTGWSDTDRALGPSPSVARPEGRAEWWKAWDTMGRPGAVMEEGNMTEGRLRTRVAAFQRIEASAPVFVDDHLRATSQEAAEAAREAAFRAADGDEETAQKLADQAAELADTAASLHESATIRDAYFATVAQEREAARRAAEELALRKLPAVGDEPDRATTTDHLDHYQQDPDQILETDVEDTERRAAHEGLHEDAAEALPRHERAQVPEVAEQIPSPREAEEVALVASQWEDDERDWQSRMASQPEEHHDYDAAEWSTDELASTDEDTRSRRREDAGPVAVVH
jgi:hypothetical protein